MAIFNTYKVVPTEWAIDSLWIQPFLSMGDLQDPIEDGGTDSIYKVYVLGLNFRGYPQKIWLKMWYVYVPPSVGSWKDH